MDPSRDYVSCLGRPLGTSARVTKMTDKTARKYRDEKRLPSE